MLQVGSASEYLDLAYSFLSTVTMTMMVLEMVKVVVMIMLTFASTWQSAKHLHVSSHLNFTQPYNTAR